MFTAMPLQATPGVALMDGRIDVDLFYDTYRESALNGLRTLDVYVVREGY